ncbi:helix-turn-helix domain-containing protein [Roseomonas sp. KE2513]|uniref:helix-turn-helix domain-containing protein n=1 Tax=Roseomonas sp. KE2513 TaxID=2479202 RepID=UPI0018DF1D42|nr:helix-turn-helix domain-containing protein [Roseomonas sp. KE2513]
MLAVAHAPDGLSRAEATRLVGLQRQALHDAVARFNATGLEGLRDRPKPGRPSTLSEPEQAVLFAIILRGSDLERDGGVEWTLPMLCRWIEGCFDKRLHPASRSRVVRGLDLSWQKTRPRPPEADEVAKTASAKGGCAVP